MNSSENFGCVMEHTHLVALSSRIISDTCNRGHRRKATAAWPVEAALAKEIAPTRGRAATAAGTLLGSRCDLATGPPMTHKTASCRISLAEACSIANDGIAISPSPVRER